MTVRAVLACVVVFLIVAATPAQDPKKEAQDTKKELDKLQGEWTMVSLEENGKKASDEFVKQFKLTVKEDKWIVNGREKPFKIDQSKDPKTLDLVFKFGNKEIVSQGIYKLEGDTLTLCRYSGRSSEKAGRPKEFKCRDNQDILVVWKRAKK